MDPASTECRWDRNPGRCLSPARKSEPNQVLRVLHDPSINPPRYATARADAQGVQ